MRNCLVIGLGRSGTSMVAGVLHHSGWKTGDNYVTARDTNPKGFFEDRAVNRLNDRLLQSGDRSPLVRLASSLGIAPVKRGLWLAAPERPMTLTQRDRFSIRRIVSVSPFAYKDPRFCHTYPMWSPHLPTETVRIVVFREPERNVASIMREKEDRGRLSLNEEEAYAIWGHSYRNLLEWRHDGAEWVFVHYDQMLDGAVIPHLERTLGAKLDRSHVDPSLRRSPSTGSAPAEAHDAYRRLCAVALEQS